MCCLFVYSHSRSAWNKFIILEKEKVFAPNNIQIKHGTGQSLPCAFFDYSNDRNIKFSKISFCTLKWKTFFSLRRLKTKLTCHITIYIFYHISFFFYKLCRKLCKFSSNTGDEARVKSRQFKKTTKQNQETKCDVNLFRHTVRISVPHFPMS